MDSFVGQQFFVWRRGWIIWKKKWEVELFLKQETKRKKLAEIFQERFDLYLGYFAHSKNFSPLWNAPLQISWHIMAFAVE